MSNHAFVKIPFGLEEQELRLSTNYLKEVLQPIDKDVPQDASDLIEAALSQPIGTKPLEELVRPGQKVAIISEDNSRFARTDLIISTIVSRLAKIGVKDQDILIVMALGSHRKMTPAEMKIKLGEEIYTRFTCVNSEFRDPQLLTYAGTAPGDVEVYVDKRVDEADVKIGVGSIVPHPALGYTGGGKILYPGVVGENTVAQLHLRSALIGQNIMGVAGNQARLEMEAWVETIGLDFIVNSIVTPENNTYKVVAGHYVEAHRVGVAYADEIYRLQAQQAVDVVIASSRSADMDLWQATKAVIGGDRIVKDGGHLVLYTPCPEGVGPHSEYPIYCKGDNIAEYLQQAKQGNFPVEKILPLSVGALIARVLKRINVDIVSPGITPLEAETAGFNHYGSTIEDLQKLIDSKYPHSTLSVLTHGGDSFAIL